MLTINYALIVVAIIWLLITLVCYACCVVGGKADEMAGYDA